MGKSKPEVEVSSAHSSDSTRDKSSEEADLELEQSIEEVVTAPKKQSKREKSSLSSPVERHANSEDDGIEKVREVGEESHLRVWIGAEAVSTLAPLVLVIAVTALLLGLFPSIKDDFEELRSGSVLNASIAAASQFFDREIKFYEFSRQAVRSGTFNQASLVDAVNADPNGTIIDDTGLEFYKRFSYGPFLSSSARTSVEHVLPTGDSWELKVQQNTILFQIRGPSPRSFEQSFDFAQGVFSGQWSSSVAVPYDPSAETWYKAAQSTTAVDTPGRWEWHSAAGLSDHVVFLDPVGTGDSASMSMAYRISWPAESTRASVFRVSFLLSELAQQLANTRRLGLGDKSAVAIIKRDGTVIAHTDQTKVLTKVWDSSPAFQDITPEALNTAATDPATTTIAQPNIERAEERFVWLRTLSAFSSDLVVVVGMHIDDLVDESVRTNTEAIIGLVFAILVLIVLRVILSIFIIMKNVRFETRLRNLTAEAQATEQLAKEQAAKAEAANEAKTRFISVMSHEIRNPLSVVMLNGELLDERVKEPELREFCTGIAHSSKVLLTIVNDVLDLTKMETGNLKLVDERLQLLTICEGALVANAQRAVAKELDLVLLIDPDCMRVIRGDPVRLHQIIHNFVSNAVKFTQEGHVILSVSVTKPGKKRAQIKFSVHDTGPGISKADQQKLFQEFSQVDRSLTRAHGGAGLGLFICRELVQKMKGKVNVQSEIGEGSTFSCEVPVKVVDSSPALFALPAANLKSLGKYTVVVAAESKVVGKGIAHQIGALLGRGPFQEFSPLPKKKGTITESPEVVTTPAGLVRWAKSETAARRESFTILFVDGNLVTAQVTELVATSSPSMIFILVVPHQITPDQVESHRAAGWSDVLPSKPVHYQALGDTMVRAYEHARKQAKVQAAMASAGYSSDSSAATGTGGGGRTRRMSTLSQSGDESHSHKKGFEAKGRILLVDDYQVMRDLVQLIIEQLHYEVSLAANGQEAVELVEASAAPFDLVFMDCEMPVMDGYEATRQIRKIEVKRGYESRMPIIAATANAMQEDRKRCLKAGMDDVLTKPIRQDGVKFIIDKYVTNRQVWEQSQAQTGGRNKSHSESDSSSSSSSAASSKSESSRSSSSSDSE